MDRNKAPEVADAREFFAGELKSLLAKHHIQTQPDSLEYLVNLLLHFIQTENLFTQGEDGRLKNPVLADLFAEYSYGDNATKHAALRRMGDVCLVVTGIFPDSLNRKLVDIDYYFGMGGTAYSQLSKMQFTNLARGLFQELSVKFKAFSDVLSEMSDRSGLQSNTDLLRLYEKWLMTKSERLRSLLGEHGINAPFNIDWNSKQ